jgi:hypothetical protein
MFRPAQHREEDAVDDNSIGEHVEVIIVPLPGWPPKRRSL